MNYSKRELIFIIEEHIKHLPYNLRPYYTLKYTACMGNVKKLEKLLEQLEKRR